MLDAWTHALQFALKTADLEVIRTIFESDPTPSKLIRFRERRLFLSVPLDKRLEVAETLLTALAVAYAEADHPAFRRYLVFLISVDRSKRELLTKLQQQLSLSPKCAMADFLKIAERSFSTDVAKALKGLMLYPPNLPVPDSELRIHNINGGLVDLANGVARVVNEAAPFLPSQTDARLNREAQDRAVRGFHRATQIAGEINSLEWLIDCVTFGEFIVAEVSDNPLVAFRLEFADERRSLVRSLSLRRTLVLKMHGRRERRYIRDQLGQLQDTMLRSGVEHYRERLGLARIEIDGGPLLRASAATLVHLGAEDDLLLAAAQFSRSVAAYYQAAMYLRWFALAGRTVVKSSAGVNKQARALQIPFLPIIALLDDGADGAHFAEALDRLTLALPVRHHSQLLSRPYVKDGSAGAVSFLGEDYGQWAVAVREALIQGGALGRSVGAIWESFTERSFGGSDWKVVGRGVKVRERGKTLTDIDLLLQREELVLVVQIKALIGSGQTPHDHRKNRQVIELGCAQAKTASDFLKGNHEALVAQCGRRGAAAIKVIQPVVITNLSHFEGWSFDDVSIISSSTQQAICNGGKVDYFNAMTGEVLETDHIVQRENLSTETILSLIRDPLELRIAPGRHGVRHIPQKIGTMAFLVPDITLLDSIAK